MAESSGGKDRRQVLEDSGTDVSELIDRVVDGGARTAQKAGESTERLSAVAAWREAPYFTGAERAARAPKL